MYIFFCFKKFVKTDYDTQKANSVLQSILPLEGLLQRQLVIIVAYKCAVGPADFLLMCWLPLYVNYKTSPVKQQQQLKRGKERYLQGLCY